jgi:hypothetical protein
MTVDSKLMDELNVSMNSLPQESQDFLRFYGEIEEILEQTYAALGERTVNVTTTVSSPKAILYASPGSASASINIPDPKV